MDKLTIHIDGASRGNPGAAGIGVVVYDEAGATLMEISEYIGQTTNNVAEYTALIRGLEEAYALGASVVSIKTDSELLARQISGIYKVKAPHLRPMYELACVLVRKFRSVTVEHVPREQNSEADRLASMAAKTKKSSRS
ncbi:MAG: ribonuclease HI family protein [Armatimonadota bacterium]|nr:ribonuclease HI family protein [Armatimonadota bacterium]